MEKNNNQEKINNLINSFAELVKEDIEEAKAVLRAAGKDPEKIAQKGKQQLKAIREKSRSIISGSTTGTSLIVYNRKEHSIFISDKPADNYKLKVSEVYQLLLLRKGIENVPYEKLTIAPEVLNLNFQKQMKELFFEIILTSEYGEVVPYYKAPDAIQLPFIAVGQLIETGYHLQGNKCHVFEEESLKFSNQLSAYITAGASSCTMPLNIALSYRAQRAAYPQLRFQEEAFSIENLITSDAFNGTSRLFTKELFTYQKDGVSWLLYCCINHIGGILADDMGLGKTAQVIALIANVIEKQLFKNILIVVPGTLLENWKREFAFFSPAITPYIHHGNNRTGSPDVLKKQQVIITSYSMIINDLYLFNKIEWGLTVLDEASLIKNPDSERRVALKQLDSVVKIAMTGTPIENSLLDLWSIADYVYPGYLGNRSEFASRYVKVKSDENLETPGLAMLKRDISYIMLRRKKEDVLDSLPEKIDIHQALTMNENEALWYDKKREKLLNSAEGGAQGADMLRLISELRMYTTHPLLKNTDDLKAASPEVLKSSSSKFSRLLELLHEIYIRKEKVLIFTEFLGMIDSLQTVLSVEYNLSLLTIDGRTPPEERQTNIDQFSRSEGFNIMVLNPKTAGMGLNITAANHVIHYTRQWNPALEQQASARAYRNGQKKSVNIYYLYYINTIEEVIDQRLRLKTELSAEVITETESDNIQEYINALSKSPIKH